MPSHARATRSLRSLAGLLLAVLVFGASWHHERTTARLVLVAIASGSFLLALLAPRVWRPVEAGIDRIVRMLLGGLTVVLLGAVFVLIFMPARLALGLMRADPLNRSFAPGQKSYWSPLKRADDAGARRFETEF